MRHPVKERCRTWLNMLVVVIVTGGSVLCACSALWYGYQRESAERRFAEDSRMALRFSADYTDGLFRFATSTMDAAVGLLAMGPPLSELPVYLEPERPTSQGRYNLTKEQTGVYDMLMAFYRAFPSLDGRDGITPPLVFESLCIGTADGGYLQAPGIEVAGIYDPRLYSWYREASTSHGKTVFTGPHLSGTGNLVYSVSNSVFDDSGVVSGVTAIHINLRELFRVLEGMLRDLPGTLLLADANGVILYNGNDTESLFLHVGELNNTAPAEAVKWGSGCRTGRADGAAMLASCITTADGWHIIKTVRRSDILAGVWRPVLPLFCAGGLLLMAAVTIMAWRIHARRKAPFHPEERPV